MTQNPSQRIFSAVVRLELVVDGRVLELVQIGRNGFIVRQPEYLAPCDAEVVMYVDGDERRWPVYLVEGMSKEKTLVKTVPRESSQAEVDAPFS